MQLNNVCTSLRSGFFFFKCLKSCWGFPCCSAGKESTCSAEDLGLIPGLGISPGGVKGYTLQYSGLENSMDCIVHGVAKSRTQLSDFHFIWLQSPVDLLVLSLVCSSLISFLLSFFFSLFSVCCVPWTSAEEYKVEKSLSLTKKLIV